jgi:hypothetical protein
MAWQDQIAAITPELDRLSQDQADTGNEIEALEPAILHQAYSGGL